MTTVVCMVEARVTILPSTVAFIPAPQPVPLHHPAKCIQTRARDMEAQDFKIQFNFFALIQITLTKTESPEKNKSFHFSIKSLLCIYF